MSLILYDNTNMRDILEQDIIDRYPVGTAFILKITQLRNIRIKGNFQQSKTLKNLHPFVISQAHVLLGMTPVLSARCSLREAPVSRKEMASAQQVKSLTRINAAHPLIDQNPKISDKTSEVGESKGQSL